MIGLDPRSEEDRRITAFTRYWEIKRYPDGTVLLGHLSYDCWGKKQHGIKKMRMTAEGAAAHIGQHNTTTLELTARGCCPPQLTKDFIMQEGAVVERDPVEEAMELHKRGYFGGGG